MPQLDEKTPLYDLKVWVTNNEKPWIPLEKVSLQVAETAQESLYYHPKWHNSVTINGTFFNTINVVAARVEQSTRFVGWDKGGYEKVYKEDEDD